MPFLSVIVPVYNSESSLPRCIDSILRQHFRDFELILVDDGSTDGSGDLCDAYAGRDARVRAVHYENSGVSAARNRGLDMASGSYCTFVDSDDYIDRDMYQAMSDIAKQYDCDVVMCDCKKEFGDHSELYTHDIRAGYYDRAELKKEYFPNLLIMPDIEYPPSISNWLCLFRLRQSQSETEIIPGQGTERKNPGFSLRYAEGIRYSEDLLFGAQMMYYADSFYYMKGRPYYHYDCTNMQSATHRFAADKWKDYKRLHKCIESFFGNCPDYDFSEQIDKTLLFFVYNAVGNIMNTNQLEYQQKCSLRTEILSDPSVRNMFQRISVFRLPVTIKLKMVTFCYKHCIGLRILDRFAGN